MAEFYLVFTLPYLCGVNPRLRDIAHLVAAILYRDRSCSVAELYPVLTFLHLRGLTRAYEILHIRSSDFISRQKLCRG